MDVSYDRLGGGGDRGGGGGGDYDDQPERNTNVNPHEPNSTFSHLFLEELF